MNYEIHPLLSIVIPCYNCADKIIEYLDSIELSLDYNAFEFIVVDDSSTDDSYKKLLDYSKKNEFNIVVDRTLKNSGPGTARNIGLDIVRGDYITFLDADDHLRNEFYTLIKDKLSGKYDLIVFDYWVVSGNEKTRSYSFFSKNHKALTIDEVVAFIKGSPWCKVIKTDIVRHHNVRFLDQKRAEDIPFIKVATSYCKTFLYIQEPLYEYVQGDNSLMHNSGYLNPQNAINAYKYIEENICKEIDNDAIEAVYIKQLLYSTSLTNARLLSRKEWKAYVVSLLQDHQGMLRNSYYKRFATSTRIIVVMIYYKMYSLIKTCLRVR